MSESDDITALIVIAEVLFQDKEQEKPRKRKIWMKSWLKDKDTFSNQRLLKELKVSQPDDFKNFMRMDEETFLYLLDKVKPLIVKQDTFMRDAINEETRLSITLRFLATGNSFEDLKFSNAVSAKSIGKIVIETCEAIRKVLKDYIKISATSDDWKKISNEFERKSGFPHCIGAIDGKHINIRKAAKSGSYYFNYKKQFSIVLMAIVNADSEFIMIDVEATGSISDGGVFNNTKFYQKLLNQELNIAEPETVDSTGRKLPYVLLGDDAFALGENLLKPFSGNHLIKEQEVFNKKLSSARVKVENAFGILAARFRVLLTTIALSPEKVTKIVIACCYLHNFLKKSRCVLYSRNESGGTFRLSETLLQIQPTASRNSSSQAKLVRSDFCEVVNRLHSTE